jgi:hypothetical protein
VTTPESTNAQAATPPELLCIMEMLVSMKRYLVLYGTVKEGSCVNHLDYTAHRRVLKYLLDRVDEVGQMMADALNALYQVPPPSTRPGCGKRSAGAAKSGNTRRN